MAKTLLYAVVVLEITLFFFLHGNSMSSATWLPQLENPELNKKYLLVAIDIPGHGDSDWLSEPGDYGLTELAEIIKLAIKIINPGRFILAGLSYGTNLIGEIVSPLQDCKGIMLVSPCIVNDQFPPSFVVTPGPNGHVVVAENPNENELREYIDYVTSNTDIADRYYKSYKDTDPAFRMGLANLMMTSKWTDELGNIKKWNIPVCVVFGEEEKLVNTNYLDDYSPLWRG
jgi:pimeloyl-ACP methyl ester carboxylesterase